MLMSRDIRVLHLEPTDVCQAVCPACARETDRAFDPAASHHLTIDQIMQHFSTQDIQYLHKMFMCGNYGDPAAGKHTLAIYHWIRNINTDITLGMNTNGGLQNSAWWQELASIMQGSQDYVVFSIDGLEDTNHIYRVNVNWHKLMQNAASFIAAGGTAHWDMLIYQHNQHQVDSCERLARDMGFRWFRAKVSRRDVPINMQMPQNWAKSPQPTLPIRCHALQEHSIYLDARGQIYPCCWLGHRTSAIHNIDAVAKTWGSADPHPTCLQTCGSVSDTTGFQNQWRRSTELIN